MGSVAGGGNSGHAGTGGNAGQVAGSILVMTIGSAGLAGGSVAQPESVAASTAAPANIRKGAKAGKSRVAL